MRLTPITPAGFARVLDHLLSVRRMGVDDALDWIDDHDEVQDLPAPLGRLVQGGARCPPGQRMRKIQIRTMVQRVRAPARLVAVGALRT